MGTTCHAPRAVRRVATIEDLPPGELVEPLLHGRKLGLEIGDLVFAAGRLRGLFETCYRGMVVLGLTGTSARKRAEQAKRALEGCKVLAHLLLHGFESRRTKSMGKTAAILLLLTGERIEAEFEVARHQSLHAVAIKADELAQEANGKQVRAPAFLLNDDLGQHRMGQIFAGFGII